MQVAKFSTLFLACVLAGPALWGAFVTRQLDVTTALTRLLIAIPVAAIMLATIRALTGGYGEESSHEEPVRAEAVTGTPLPGRRSND
jgi:uncharacterized membrane protein